MKKLFFLLAMMFTTVGAFAQSFEPVEPDGQEYSSTWIIAQLKTNLTESKIVIAAYIGDECRVVVTPEGTNVENGSANGAPIYSIRVPNYKRGEDKDKDIYFRAYDPQSGLEYTLREKFKFEEDATYGTPANPVTLNLTAPTSYTITLGEIAKDVQYSLANCLSVVPANAIVPDNLKWAATVEGTDETGAATVVPAEGITIRNGVLKAAKVLKNVTLSVSAENGETPLATALLDVVSHATEVRIVKDALDVEKSEYGTKLLNQFVSNPDALPYTILPEDNTDAANVTWKVQAVQGEDAVLKFENGVFTILKGGTAKIRPVLTYVNKNKKDDQGNPVVVTIYPKDANGNEAWVTVTVTVPITDIEIDEALFGTPVKANIGDENLYDRLSKIVKIMPLDATNRNFRFLCTDGSVKVDNDAKTITPLKTGAGIVYVVSEGKTALVESVVNNAPGDPSGADASAGGQEKTMEIPLFIENPAMSAELKTPAMYINVNSETQEVEMESLLKEYITYVDKANQKGNVKQNLSITIKPVQGTSVTGEATIGGEDGDVYSLKAKGYGTTRLQIKLKWNDYDAWKGTPNAIPAGVEDVYFDVIVQKESILDRMYAEYTQAATGKDIVLTLTPFPQNATFNPDDIELSFAQSQYGDWSDKVITSSKVSASADAVKWKFSTAVPGNVTVTVREKSKDRVVPVYQNQTQLTAINVAYTRALNKDWQWCSNPWGGVKSADIATVFGGEKEDGKLFEIRTQTDLLYNDSTYGYFGTLMDDKTINMFECYKVRMKEAYSGIISSDETTNKTVLPTNVEITNAGVSITLATGWNWVGYPYFYNRGLAKVMNRTGVTIPDGMVIVGKQGSVEYDAGKNENSQPNWDNGSLEYFHAGQGYLMYNPSDKDLKLTFPSELAWEPENEDGAENNVAGVKAYSLSNGSIWSYDHSRFMNNMTMVCVLSGLDNPERYSVGAFVGNECRGEGFVKNNKVFVTVHCDANEIVHFKLYNTLTGDMEDIVETVRARTRVGSLKSPYRLHGTATGIDSIEAEGAETTAYDLAGRRVSGQANNGQRGIILQRMANGSYRKVVVK